MEAFKRHHLRLLVDDFGASFRFYRDILELPVRYGGEDADYAEFKSDAIHLALFGKRDMAQVAGTLAKNPCIDAQDRLAVVLRVDDVDAVYRRLKGKGVAFDTAPEDRRVWGCRTALFRDPEGNLFELNADLPPPDSEP